MGYTHYWRMQNSIPSTKWKNIVADFEKLIVDQKYFLTTLLSKEGEDALIIDADQILFNGKKEAGHEWFILQSKISPEEIARQERIFGKEEEEVEHPNFFFCKTARKPYDVCVTACLIIAKHYLGNEIKISSDGETSEWNEAKTYCQEILGYGKSFQFVDRQDGQELEEMKPSPTYFRLVSSE